jgi:hypothetical protein
MYVLSLLLVEHTILIDWDDEGEREKKKRRNGFRGVMVVHLC